MIQRALIAGLECGRVALESERCGASDGPLPGDWSYLTTCLGRAPNAEEEHAFIAGWYRGMGHPDGADSGRDTTH